MNTILEFLLNPVTICIASVILTYAWWTWFFVVVLGTDNAKWKQRKEWQLIPYMVWGGPVMWVFMVLAAIAVTIFRLMHGYWK